MPSLLATERQISANTFLLQTAELQKLQNLQIVLHTSPQCSGIPVFIANFNNKLVAGFY